jgi:hypothetical protein
MADQETPVVPVAPKLAIKAFEDGIPSNWVILETEQEGVITARSNLTNEVFEGTIEDFNKLLRG